MNEQTFTLDLKTFRKEDRIEGWPVGSNKRATAVFTHETKPKRGQRIVRVTTGKPKPSTYYLLVCLANGSDGKTHYIGLTQFGHLAVMSCDMKHSDFSVFRGDPNYDEYLGKLREVAG